MLLENEMQFHCDVQVATLAASLASGFIMPRVPNGFWKAEQYANGTIITTSMDDPTLPPIYTQGEYTPRTQKRDTIGGGGACWGYFLDHGAVDTENQSLQDWCTKYNPFSFCSNVENAYYTQIIGETMIYLCIDTTNKCGAFYADNIRDGMARMDALCKP
jgi:hypothetical protein